MIEEWDIPEQCQRCLNNYQGECQAMKDFQREDCFAFTISSVELLQTLSSIQKYSGKSIDTEEIRRLRKLTGVEIQLAFFEDTHRGSGKGGNSKGKNMNKKKYSGKKFIIDWSGY